jgi:alpha-galactosidase
LNVRDSNVRTWLPVDLSSSWKPEEFKGETIDLGVPAAREWAERETDRIVKDNGLDMLEHDGYLVLQGCAKENHPHAPPSPQQTILKREASWTFVLNPNSTDVSYHATRAYYEIQTKLRKQHPGLLLEICNDGGRMVDFGSAAHGDYFSVTDAYDPLSNRRAFYDASWLLPPAMLETYVERWPTPDLGTFRYMLRSGMMGWFTLMLDTTSWSAEQRVAARESIALYKERLRPLIRDAELFHISARPDGIHWDAIEYFDPKVGRGAVFVFRGSAKTEPSHNFLLQGLRGDAIYRAKFQDGSSPDRTVSGADLMRTGLEVELARPQWSEIVFIDEVGRAPERSN